MTRVAVVGAGINGLATAWALRNRGVDAVVYEQYEVGHRRGSSHGSSRIFRLAYADPEWVHMAQDALAGWRRLERESGVQLLELHGLVEVVRELAQSSADCLERCGVPYEVLDAEEAGRRFPIRVPRDAVAVVQPEGGTVRADRALSTLGRLVDVRERTPVRLADVDADAVVVTAGGWAGQLLADEGIDLPVKVTRETVAYFALDESRPVPSVVSFKPTGGHDFYALSDPAYGLKVGAHHAGPEVDPDEPGEPDAAVVDEIAAWAERVFPRARPEPAAADTCIYTTTADEKFVLERHGRIVVGSACSGHAFKMAPAVGERLADLALAA